MGMSRKKLSAEEQLIFAMEELAIGRELIIKKKKRLSASALAGFICDLQSLEGETKRSKSSEPERTVRNYRKQFDAFNIPVSVDFQMKIIDNYEDNFKVIKKICKLYLQRICINYDDGALTRFIKNIPDIGDSLYYLVAIKYSILFGFPLEFEYQKLGSGELSRRIVIPYGIAVRGNFLNIVGRDHKDNRDKQFILSRFTNLYTDLYDSYKMIKGKRITKKNFNYSEYLASSEGKFKRKPVKYRIKLLENSFDHFTHTYSFDYKIIEKESEENAVIEIESVDRIYIMMIIFSYGKKCKLLDPESEVRKFKEHLSELMKWYNE